VGKGWFAVKSGLMLPGTEHPHSGGKEIYVMRGEIRDEDGSYPAGTWLRRPPGSQHCLY